MVQHSWRTGQGRRAPSGAWLILPGLVLAGGVALLWGSDRPDIARGADQGADAAQVVPAVAIPDADGACSAAAPGQATESTAPRYFVPEPDDPEPAATPAPREPGEAAHRAEWEHVAARSAAEFMRLAQTCLDEPGSLARKVAALQVAAGADLPQAPALFARAVRSADPQLAAFALRHQVERATDPKAAAVIRELAFDPSPSLDPAARRRAMAAHARHAGAADWSRLAAEITRAQDPLLEATILSALEQAEGPGLAAVLGLHGRPIPHAEKPAPNSGPER